jgi:hypothetical protein
VVEGQNRHTGCCTCQDSPSDVFTKKGDRGGKKGDAEAHLFWGFHPSNSVKIIGMKLINNSIVFIIIE